MLPLPATAQSHKIDSLRSAIQSSATDALRLKNILLLCQEKNSLRGDTLLRYALQAKELAVHLNDKNSEAWAELNLMAHLIANGKADSLLLQADAFIKKVSPLTDRKLYYRAQLLKANALNRNNQLNKALELQLQLLTEAEKDGETESGLFIQNYLGATWLNLNNPAEAQKWWLKGLEIIEKNKELNYRYIEATILGNMGLLYYNRYIITHNRLTADTGLLYLDRCIETAEKNESLGALASGLVLKGNLLSATGQLTGAEQNLKRGIDIRSKVGDPFYMMQDLVNLGSYYYTNKQYQKSITAITEALALADASNLKADRLQMIGVLGYNYKALNNYEQYSKVLEQFILTSDSNNRINGTKQLAEIQTKYDVQKKETLIAQQKLDLLQRKLLLYSAGVLAALLITFSIFRFKKYQQRQKIRVAALVEEEKKQSELAVKDAEEKERKRIAAELHDNLGVQANAILHNSTLLADGKAGDKNVVADLQETAKEMLLNLRETLWAMKTADVAAMDMWLRIINFMKQMGRHYTTVHFVTAGDVPEGFIIPSQKALNMVLVLQEAVNNAVKHAHAATITAKSTKAGNGWAISIADDGNGFDMRAVKEKTDSYGLQNMAERAAAGNFIYGIEATPGKGTVITISVSA